MASQQQSGRAASRARRQMQVNGKGRSAAAPAPTRQPKEGKSVPAANPTPAPASQAAAPVASSFTAPAPQSMPRPKRAQKSASRLRRESLAARGKKADRSSDRLRDSEMALKRRSAAEAKAKAGKGNCDCGGPCCQEAEANAAAAAAPAPSLSASASSSVNAVKRKRVMNASDTGRLMSRARRAAMSGRGKAGLEAHGKGSSSASLARQANPEISARDIARVVRDSRSKNGARGNSAAAPACARRPRNAAEAKAISGTKVEHTEKLTGDEAGLCHSGVTGTSYMSSDVFDKFCQGGHEPKAAKKVEQTETISGSRVTSGGKVGGSSVMTGNEAGSCRAVTGIEYLGREDYVQCGTTPPAPVVKTSASHTQRGQVVSGPKSSRAENVTGNENGSCRAVTGTPYAGQEQFESFCAPEEQRNNRMLTVMPERAPGAGKDITGQQPGLIGKKMTGAEEGVCQPVSGTPYIASSEMSAVCAASPAKVGESDFPKPVAEVAEGKMSVVPTVASAGSISGGSVTGSGYEGEGPITGAFSMGQGKVTGTEQSRFGGRSENVITVTPKEEKAVATSRITGEGIETGLNITGDDWDRGDRVTGTEGASAVRRNPSRSGPMSAMPEIAAKREPMVDRPSADVTGGSGGSQGSSITVSGGARG